MCVRGVARGGVTCMRGTPLGWDGLAHHSGWAEPQIKASNQHGVLHCSIVRVKTIALRAFAGAGSSSRKGGTTEWSPARTQPGRFISLGGAGCRRSSAGRAEGPICCGAARVGAPSWAREGQAAERGGSRG